MIDLARLRTYVAAQIEAGESQLQAYVATALLDEIERQAAALTAIGRLTEPRMSYARSVAALKKIKIAADEALNIPED